MRLLLVVALAAGCTDTPLPNDSAHDVVTSPVDAGTMEAVDLAPPPKPGDMTLGSATWSLDRAPYADPPALAAAQVLPRSLAVDESNLYWVEGGASPALVSMPKGGGARTTLTPVTIGLPIAVPVVLDETSVYWGEPGSSSQPGSIHRIAKRGGPATLLATCSSPARPLGGNGFLGHPAGLAVDDQLLYFTENDGTPFGTMPGSPSLAAAMPKAGGAVVVIADEQDHLDEIAVEPRALWMVSDSEATVMRAAPPSWTTTGVGPGDEAFTFVRADGRQVYVANQKNNGATCVLDESGQLLRCFSAGSLGDDSVAAMAQDGGWIYFATRRRYTTGPMHLVAWAKDGSSPATVLLDATWMTSLAADGVCLYFADVGAIRRLCP